MKEYIKKFASVAAADGYEIEPPFTTSIVGGGNLVCNEDLMKLKTVSGETSVVPDEPGPDKIFYKTIDGNVLNIPYPNLLKQSQYINIIDNNYNKKGIISFNENLTIIGGDSTSGAFTNSLTLYKISLPYGLTNIGGSTFKNCSNLSSIIIPNSITSIGPHAFKGCSSLTSVTIPNSVTSIGTGTFNGCTGLTHIKIPNSVTSMGVDVFRNNPNLLSVIITSGITQIPQNSFVNCTGLISITCNATTPPLLDAYDLSFCSNLQHIYVPTQSVDAYKAASGWSNYASIIEAIPE